MLQIVRVFLVSMVLFSVSFSAFADDPTQLMGRWYTLTGGFKTAPQSDMAVYRKVVKQLGLNSAGELSLEVILAEVAVEGGEPYYSPMVIIANVARRDGLEVAADNLLNATIENLNDRRWTFTAPDYVHTMYSVLVEIRDDRRHARLRECYEKGKRDAEPVARAAAEFINEVTDRILQRNGKNCETGVSSDLIRKAGKGESSTLATSSRPGVSPVQLWKVQSNDPYALNKARRAYYDAQLDAVTLFNRNNVATCRVNMQGHALEYLGELSNGYTCYRIKAAKLQSFADPTLPTISSDFVIATKSDRYGNPVAAEVILSRDFNYNNLR